MAWSRSPLVNNAVIAEFGEAATLTQDDGTESTLTIVASRTTNEYGVLAPGVSAGCLSADYAEADYRRGDALTIDGKRYAITAAVDDRDGWTELTLER